MVSTGFSDCKEIVTEGEIVDKTLLIKEILETKAKAMLITRPRRWGKTTNMSMLNYFFSPEGADENKSMFENLKIGKEYRDILNEYQGKYPVIFISLKNIEGDNYEEIESGFKYVIGKLFKQHEYLVEFLTIQNKPSSQTNLQIFQELMDEKSSIARLVDSLRFLSELLYQ